MKTYYIEAARYEKNEYRIEDKRFYQEYRTKSNPELTAYNEMVNMMKNRLQPTPDNKIVLHKLEPEYNTERSMNITSHETTLTGPVYRVIPDNEIVRNADEPFQDIKPQLPYEAKGYDLAEDAYFFATVDAWRTVKPYQAESPEQALQMAKGDQLHNVLARVQPVRHFLHASKEEKATLVDGTIVNIVTEKEFQDRLREKFPDGLTIRLADESFSNLQKLNDWNYTNGEGVDWMGLANPGNTRMLVAHGNIPAELHLEPKDYEFIYACEDTYYDKELYNMIEDEGAAAPSLLLTQEYKMEAMRVKIPKTPYLLDKLYIAGKSYDTMMKMAKDNMVKDDRDFENMLNKAYMHSQPEWLKTLAREQTKEQRHRSFINLTAKATAEYNRAYNRLLEESVTKFGYGPVKQFKDLLYNPETVPDDLKDKVYQAAVYIHQEMQQYEREQDKAYEKYNRACVNLEAQFVHKFNDFIKSHVNEVSMYPNNQGKWNVRCKIDGEQQMGRQITDSDARIRKESNGNFQSIKLMACKYFKDEIVSAMTTGQEQQQSKSLRR